MSNVIQKIQASRSLRVQIGILYSILALINILFFSVMIFENQTELLVKNFNYQSVNFVIQVMDDLKDKEIPREKNDKLDKFISSLRFHDIQNYSIFDKNGLILHKSDDVTITEIDKETLKKAEEISDTSSIFTSKYKLELNKEDFTINFLIPMKGEVPGEILFLNTHLSIRNIQDRLTKLYYQIGIAFIWGVFTHILFGIYINRVIFSRVEILKKATDEMGSGNLKARASWKFDREDELDVLGTAFNGMAAKIEETIETISTLNEEISKELKIGKEVQEMFLPLNKKFKDFKVATFYRPMREVSGDIYHFYKFRNARIPSRKYTGFFFADASGHGVSAALVTTVTLLSIENIIAKSIRPNYIIQQLANVIGNRFQSSFFATGVFFLVNEKGKMICSNAGHNAPICFRPSTGEMFFFKSCGPPLGMADDFDYKLLKANTRTGDKLFIYSDGLTESPGLNDEQFSEERVIDLIKNNMHASNKELLKIIWEELDKFALDYRDDVSMVLLEIP
ncbi:MAG: SpoIIE family protein phosphatase [Leptospiraceae bacterium]|nr:SpoIIE family protein phosphatase [Leptospiraceae bacterium]MCP5512471.1 SpoIIE family protein phosphatase [Leptospiraceae bacterium]